MTVILYLEITFVQTIYLHALCGLSLRQIAQMLRTRVLGRKDRRTNRLVTIRRPQEWGSNNMAKVHTMGIAVLLVQLQLFLELVIFMWYIVHVYLLIHYCKMKKREKHFIMHLSFEDYEAWRNMGDVTNNEGWCPIIFFVSKCQNSGF